MTEKKDIFSVCLDCATALDEPENTSLPSCPTCGGTRISRHRELPNLVIAHVDCDAFYAAIEKRDRPDLADRPVIIGGGKRGVVSTACYIARTYGVHSAMPMFKALQACPDAVVVKPDFEKYQTASRHIREMMGALTPLVEPLSIDEAFLDLTGCESVLNASAAQALVRLQIRVKEEVGVSVSVGLSWNKFLAKLASDLDKPNGFTVIGRAETAAVLAPLPITKMWGVGKATAKKLEKDGIRQFRDLQKLNEETCRRRYGDHGVHFKNLSIGRDERQVKVTRETKSLSAETTFDEDISDFDTLDAKLWRLCEKVSRRLKEKSLTGRTVTLKLRYANFKSITRQAGLSRPTNLARAIYHIARPLLEAECPSRGPRRHQYRLIGVGLSDFGDDSVTQQEDFFDETPKHWVDQEDAVDAIRAKFGDSAIISGRALKDGRRPNAKKQQGN